MRRMWSARSRLLANRYQPHLAHQSANPLPPNLIAEPSKTASHLPVSIPGRFKKLFVYQMHERQIQPALAGFLIVETGAAKAKKTALPGDAEPGMTGFDHTSPSDEAQRPKALSKKSRSTINWPILA